LSLYGDKAKPQTFAARFQTPDGSEVLSVVIRPSNQLKITFLEAKDISDLGSLKAAARLFVPGAATIYSARTIKVKEEEGLRQVASNYTPIGSGINVLDRRISKGLICLKFLLFISAEITTSTSLVEMKNA
jgi:5-enolpyruvylshikimate-3-phosphate synthase